MREDWREKIGGAGSLRRDSGLKLRDISSLSHLTAMGPGDKSSSLILFLPSDPNPGSPLANANQNPEGRDMGEYFRNREQWVQAAQVRWAGRESIKERRSAVRMCKCGEEQQEVGSGATPGFRNKS